MYIHAEYTTFSENVIHKTVSKPVSFVTMYKRKGKRGGKEGKTNWTSISNESNVSGLDSTLPREQRAM